MISGKTIELRCLEHDDLSRIVEWRNQKEIRKFFFDKSLISMSSQKKWFERYLEDPSKEIFIAVSKQTTKPIGMIGLYQIDPNNHKAEIGSTMVGDPSMWGKGTAAEMIGLVLEYAFEDLNLNRIYAYAVDYNKGSVRVKEKCGFQLEGTLRQDHYANGRFHDVQLLGITREFWEAGNA
jgi:UDP-4-amino-4,6-dideoxy-N-acetyl-beta-L-altrosamine N-acetyltransferase